MIEVASLVLVAADPEATAAFYRALGVEIEDEDHGEGPVRSLPNWD
jgi:catechol 2,3-dioxygenase-like lactoylglutathione lyase family enzyme